jgi:hypothetical protein
MMTAPLMQQIKLQITKILPNKEDGFMEGLKKDKAIKWKVS